tara:strand:- start:2135 stop:2680 length:546 start_codon:yes stop_codon:yes gene_type:complete
MEVSFYGNMSGNSAYYKERCFETNLTLGEINGTNLLYHTAYFKTGQHYCHESCLKVEGYSNPKLESVDVWHLPCYTEGCQTCIFKSPQQISADKKKTACKENHKEGMRFMWHTILQTLLAMASASLAVVLLYFMMSPITNRLQRRITDTQQDQIEKAVDVGVASEIRKIEEQASGFMNRRT